MNILSDSIRDGRARHSVRAVVWLARNGAHGVTHPANHADEQSQFHG